jgi:hypothetical protein
MNYLTKLRKKPKHVRDNIAFVAAGVATLPVMAYLVLAVHGPRVTGGITETDTPKTKFFETFTSQIKEQVATVREATSAPVAESPKFPSTVYRGPLDAVPVEPQATSSIPARFSASTSTSSSTPQNDTAPTATR